MTSCFMMQALLSAFAFGFKRFYRIVNSVVNGTNEVKNVTILSIRSQ